MVVVDMNLEASQVGRLIHVPLVAIDPEPDPWQALADKIDGTAIRANVGAEMDIRKVIVQVTPFPPCAHAEFGI